MAEYLIIANPIAGRGIAKKRTDELLRLFTKAKLGFEKFETEAQGDAYDCALREAGRHETIVVLGGDGSIQEVAGGLMAARTQDAVATPRLGVIPAGTGNDFIKAAGIPNELEAAFDLLIAGRMRDLDLGRIEWRETDEDETRQRYFVNNVGVGFEGQVGYEAERIKLPIRGIPLYFLALMRVLGRLENPPMRIRFGSGESLEAPTLLVSIGNGRSSGGGFQLNPDADPFDGLFDICLSIARSRIGVLRLLPKAMRGKHTRLPGVTCRQDRLIELESANGFHGHADGELLSASIVWMRAEIIPGALALIC